MINPLTNPLYRIGAYLLAVALVVFLLVRIGHGMGHKAGTKAEAKRVEPIIAKLLASNQSLTDELQRIQAAIRDANAVVQREAVIAAQQQAAAAQALVEARAERQRLASRMTALDAQLKAERAGCPEAEAKICGIPLR